MILGFTFVDPPRPGEVPLSVEIEGTAEVSLLPSQTRSFTCRVNSSAVIRWTFNGGNLPSNVQMNGTGGHTSILTIVSASSSNEGIYACLVHSQSGAFRDSSEIRVLFYGKILHVCTFCQAQEYVCIAP